MSNKIKKVRGVSDYYAKYAQQYAALSTILREVFTNYGYEYIKLPMLESLSLFSRSIGEATDIVEKEMFVIEREKENIALRPEGTAGCVRACIENGLINNGQQQRLWYMGSMFRYERPQKGRYREFNQFGVEVFNLPNPSVEAEQILMTSEIWKKLGVIQHLTLKVNSLGDLSARELYRNDLISYFESNEHLLDEDSKRRLHKNPLRILDSKNQIMQDMIAKAPKLQDYLTEECAQHFKEFCVHLDDLGISYEVDTRLVRGLDYYNRTVYEWVTDKLGSQSAICGGGRYDSLVEQLGGASTPGVGFAAGVERILLLLEECNIELASNNLDCYLVCFDKIQKQSLSIAKKIRDALPGIKIKLDHSSGKPNKLLQRASKSGARYALLFGADEIDNNKVTVRDLTNFEQNSISWNELPGLFKGDL